MSDNLQLTVTDANGDVYTITGNIIDAVIKKVPPAVVTPPPLVFPVIPAIAIKNVLDNLTTWAGEYDTSTPRAATGSSKAVTGGREFLISYTNKAGYRFHVNFGKDTTSKNFVYDLTVMAKDWTQPSRLELDTNQVLADGRTVMMCLQAAAGGSLGSGTWELTFSNTPHAWNPSNVKIDTTKWAPGSTHRIRLVMSRDDNGVVTYIGVETDGVYQLFAQPASTGPSVKSLGWAVGSCLVNYQMEGSKASGAIDTIASITMYRW